MIGELFDPDYFYFFYVPILVSVALAAVLRRRPKLVTPLVLAGGVGLLLTNVPRAAALADLQGWVGLVSFFALPLLGIFGACRLPWVGRRPWTLVLFGPVGFFLGFSVGVNLWLLCGYPI